MQGQARLKTALGAEKHIHTQLRAVTYAQPRTEGQRPAPLLLTVKFTGRAGNIADRADSLFIGGVVCHRVIEKLRCAANLARQRTSGKEHRALSKLLK